MPELLGIGVDGLVLSLFALGRELAFVVSLRQTGDEGGSVGLATFVRGDDAGPPGDDFWKKEKMDCCCLAEDEGGFPIEPLLLAGVRAAAPPALSPAIAVGDV